MRRAMIKWALVQFVAIFCLVAVAVTITTLILRPHESLIFNFATLSLNLLLASLFVHFQEWASEIDPILSERFRASVSGTESRLEEDW